MKQMSAHFIFCKFDHFLSELVIKVSPLLTGSSQALNMHSKNKRKVIINTLHSIIKINIIEFDYEHMILYFYSNVKITYNLYYIHMYEK